MDPIEIKKSQQQIKNEDYILNYDDETLKYVKKPIGNALYTGRPKMDEEDKGKPNDKVECKLCGKVFTRSNRSKHKRTQRHKLYEKVNTKMAKMVLND